MANDTQNWPELTANLYDRLTEGDAEITYEFEDFELDVPSSTSENADHVHWKIDGMISIRTRNRKDQ